MASSSVQDNLKNLRGCVEHTTVHGGFLVSTGEISNHWIPIEALRGNKEATEAIVALLSVCLPNLVREANVETVCVPVFTTPEGMYGVDPLVQQVPAFMGSAASNPIRDMQTLLFNPRLNEVILLPDYPGGTWLCIFNISSYVGMIEGVVNGLRDSGRAIHHVIVLIEREREIRRRLELQSVQVVPLIICDEQTGDPKTVLEMEGPPYTSYRKYFDVGSSGL